MDKAEMKRLLQQQLKGMRLMNERVAQERRESTPEARFRGAAMYFQVQPIDPDGEKKEEAVRERWERIRRNWEIRFATATSTSTGA